MDESQLFRMARGEESLLNRFRDVVGFLQASARPTEHHDRAIEYLASHSGRVNQHYLFHRLVLKSRLPKWKTPRIILITGWLLVGRVAPSYEEKAMNLSTEHQQVADMARRFANEVIRPE